MKGAFTYLTAVVLFIVFMNFEVFAADNISFNGQEYTLDDNTILLDKENIYDIPKSITNANEAFNIINSAKGNVTLLVAP